MAPHLHEATPDPPSFSAAILQTVCKESFQGCTLMRLRFLPLGSSCCAITMFLPLSTSRKRAVQSSLRNYLEKGQFLLRYCLP